jgi:hypothetical protein
MTHRLSVLLATAMVAACFAGSVQASASFHARAGASGPLGPAWWGWSGPGWGYVGPGGGRGWVGNGWGWRGANGYAAPTYISGVSCRRWAPTPKGWTTLRLC